MRDTRGIAPRATMTHRIGEPSVTVVVRAERLVVPRGVERLQRRVRVLQPQEAAAELRLVPIVDHDGVVSGCAAEIAPPRHGAIREGARIDEDRQPPDTQRKGERIGMSVSRDREITEWT